MATKEPSSGASLAGFSEQLADAVQTAAASVVRVKARRGPGASGIVLAPNLVLTADHVVDPNHENDIRIGLPDGTEASASLAGRDPVTDVAVLRLAERQSLTPARGVSAEPRVGTLAVAVARPERDVAASLALVTGHGGPSRTRRGGILERYLLVDVVMYPGFSGGPLLDPGGQVLGMNTSGLAVGGPGVAIPWSLVERLGQTIAQHGSVRRGYLGIGSQPVALEARAQESAGGQQRGLLVLHVAEGGPAAEAGFLQGDILVRLADSPISTADDLQALLGPERVGTVLKATVLRGGALQDLQVTVGARNP